MNIPKAKKRRKATTRKKSSKKAIKKIKKEIEKPMDVYVKELEDKLEQTTKGMIEELKAKLLLEAKIEQMSKEQFKKEMDKSEKEDDEFIWEIHSKEKLYILTRLEVLIYVGIIMGIYSFVLLIFGIIDYQYLPMFLLVAFSVSIGICGVIIIYRSIKKRKEKQKSD